MKDEEYYEKCNGNNITTDTLFQSPVAMNEQKKDANMTYQRQIASVILAETTKYFKGCTIQSTINDSAYYDSNEQVDSIKDSEEQVDAINDSEEQVDAISDSEELVDAVSDPKSDPSSNPKVATYTTNGISQKLLRSWFVPKIF